MCFIINFIFLRVQTEPGDGFCEGVIISPNHILTYRCPRFFFGSPVSLFFRRRKVVEKPFFKFQRWPSLTIKKPNWTEVDEFYILTLEKPLKSDTKHAPICISDCEKTTNDRVYFNWYEKQHKNDDQSIGSIIHHSNIQKKRKYHYYCIAFYLLQRKIFSSINRLNIL